MALPEGAAILQVLPALRSGGVEQGTIEITEAITASGGRAIVASAGGPLVAAVERAGGVHVTLPLASKNPLTIWRNAARLAALIRAERIRVVHARSRAPAWSAFWAARRTGARFLTTFHAPYRETSAWRHAYNQVMARGERVIAISGFIAELVQSRYGVRSGMIRTIPRGVDLARFDPDRVAAERTAALRERWGLAMWQPTVMLPGRLSRWKGHAVLIQALKWSRTPGLLAVFVGPTEGRERYQRELQALAERLGVADRIRFVGGSDDMPAALSLASLVVSPSTEPEGFGRTVIEAQAMACSVIVSDHGGAAETVDHGVTGWRVPPGDPVALAAAIDRVLALSESERRVVGNAARHAVANRYTVAAMQQATLQVYAELLA